MAFDLYVGTFTRFYRREWENIAQRHARETGTRYTMVYAGGEPEPPPPPDEIRGIIGQWRDAINQQIGGHLDRPLAWDESDSMRYFTDRPAWQGYGALILWAAYAAQPQMKRPLKVNEDWAGDPAFDATYNAPRLGPFGNLVRGNLWIPGDFKFTFNFINPVHEEVMIGSTTGLLESLNALNEATFKGSASDIAQWRRGDDADTDELEPVARFGFSIFHSLTVSAVEHGLPIIQSF